MSARYGGKNGSQHYRAGDSMLYHNSMFLKRLSHAAPEEEKHAGWRQKLGHFLESRPENIFIFSLIVLDLLIICAQLFVIGPHEHCKHGMYAYLANTTSDEPAHIAKMDFYMSLPQNHTSSEHEPPESPEDHAYEIAGAVLDYMSFTILGVLGVEIILLLVAFGADFFKQPLYILDALVIAASFTLELIPTETQGGAEAQGGALLIVFRLWRIVRIVHGVAMSVQEKNEETIKQLEAEVEHLKKDKTTLTTKLEYLKKKYKKLITHEDEDEGLPKLPNYEHDDHPPLPSLDHPPNYDPHAATHSPPTTKTIRIQDDRSDVDSDDDSDYDDDKKDKREVVVGINDDRDVRQPLVRSPPRTTEYSTFAKK